VRLGLRHHDFNLRELVLNKDADYGSPKGSAFHEQAQHSPLAAQKSGHSRVFRASSRPEIHAKSESRHQRRKQRTLESRQSQIERK
jgi:hypothetical protein